MKFNDWITDIIHSGLLCSEYTKRVENAMNKKSLMDIVLDANGVSYLLEMQEKGKELPYETILREFKPYLNGRYIGIFKNEKGNGYTSKIYCCYDEKENIITDTTATVLLGCKNRIIVPEYSLVKIYADNNCDIEIECPKTSKCIVEACDNALIGVSRSNNNVELTRMKK